MCQESRKIAGRGPGRPRKVSAPLAAVQDLIANLEEQARDNARLRDTLEQIGRMIDRVV